MRNHKQDVGAIVVVALRAFNFKMITVGAFISAPFIGLHWPDKKSLGLESLRGENQPPILPNRPRSGTCEVKGRWEGRLKPQWRRSIQEER